LQFETTYLLFWIITPYSFVDEKLRFLGTNACIFRSRRAVLQVDIIIFIIIYLTPNGFLPDGSGTTKSHKKNSRSAGIVRSRTKAMELLVYY
jgi:hypothetical protein